jgi:hypothetical protein
VALAAVARRDARVVYAPIWSGGARFADAYGIEKSVVSEQFIEASRQKLRELIERRWET